MDVLELYLVSAGYVDDDEGQQGLKENREVQDPVVHRPLKDRESSGPKDLYKLKIISKNCTYKRNMQRLRKYRIL